MGCITWQRVALRTADFLISAVVVLFLLTAGAYSAYALWDNNQVYAAVDNVQGELLQFKPAADGENGAQAAVQCVDGYGTVGGVYIVQRGLCAGLQIVKVVAVILAAVPCYHIAREILAAENQCDKKKVKK